MSDKSCKTCMFHNPKGTLDTTHSNCWSCSSHTLAGTMKYPAWQAKPVVEPPSPTAVLAARELATRLAPPPMPHPSIGLWTGTCPPGTKADEGKRQYSLLPEGSVEEVVDVLTIGARKYAPENWKRVQSPRTRYFDAAMRHITTWFRGEKLDPETGKNHLAHAVTCLLFLLWFDHLDEPQIGK